MKEIVIQMLKKATGLPESDLSNSLEVPPNPELGDYAFPCFPLAGKYKKNPVAIAQEISEKIQPHKAIERVNVSGPYLNFFISPAYLAEKVILEVQKEKDKYGSSNKKEKVVIEFPSPNTNKPLHIGHVRNIVLGQAITNILKFSGKETKIVNLYNDRGVHICKSMVAYEKYGKGTTPEKEKKKADHLIGDFYVRFAKAVEKKELTEEDAQLCLQKWESGDKNTLLLWKKMNSWAYSGFNETYKKFNFKSDEDMYESKIYKEGKDIVSSGLTKGIFQKKEDGAIFIDLNKYGLGEKVVLRADGTSIYVTQDLYLALLKKQKYNFDSSIYVSASEQNYHFRVLFKILELLGHKWASKMHHLSYGMVNLESGRMKSREGTVVDADDVIKELENLSLEELKKRYKNLSSSELKKRSEAIAMSALRYYLIKVDKTKDIVFKPEESISFEGDTGPYLLYSYARAKSILTKAKYKPSKLVIKKLDDSEKQLVIKIGKFPEIVSHAMETLSPSLIANYAFQLAQTFNEFYHSSQVIGSEREKIRLSLVQVFAQTLKNSLSLLNINVIEKM